MIQRRAAHRYALALIGSAKNNGEIELLVEDMRKLHDTMIASRDLRVFLQSPVVNKEKKKDILRSLLANKLSAPMQRFIMLLCEKRRENILPVIIEEFNVLYDDHMGIIRPRVTSAVLLTDAEKKALEAQLGARYKKQVVASYTVDTAVQGGMAVQIGDTIVNGTVRHHLALLRKRMLAGVN